MDIDADCDGSAVEPTPLRRLDSENELAVCHGVAQSYIRKLYHSLPVRVCVSPCVRLSACHFNTSRVRTNVSRYIGNAVCVFAIGRRGIASDLLMSLLIWVRSCPAHLSRDLPTGRVRSFQSRVAAISFSFCLHATDRLTQTCAEVVA